MAESFTKTELPPEGDNLTRTLVLGRALHPPWNEGTRVINRNFAIAAASRRSVRLMSLTLEEFRDCGADDVNLAAHVEHVYSRAGYGLVGMYRGLPLLQREIGGRRLDIAHLFGVPLALAPGLRHHGAKVVAHVMTTSSRATDRLLNAASVRLFDRWVDAYAVTSPILVAPLVRRGVPAAKVVVVPPAIDTTRFRPGARLAARASLGIDPDERVVVYLGRLSPRRFPAADIAPGLRRAAEQTGRQLRLVGLSPGQTYDGSENTAEYLLACSRAAAAELRDLPGVTPDIRFGDLADAHKIAWLQAADAVLFPFAQPEAVEPPLTLLEALACGATVLATSMANRSTIVEHGRNGYVYDGPTQLADLLAVVLADDWSEPGLASAARATVEGGFSFAASIDATERLWQRMEHGQSRRDAQPVW